MFVPSLFCVCPSDIFSSSFFFFNRVCSRLYLTPNYAHICVNIPRVLSKLDGSLNKVENNLLVSDYTHRFCSCERSCLQKKKRKKKKKKREKRKEDYLLLIQFVHTIYPSDPIQHSIFLRDGKKINSLESVHFAIRFSILHHSL